jgi:hypothetical protein
MFETGGISHLTGAFMNAVKEYDTRIDLKKRVTIRGALYDHYHVTEFDDGRIVLEPRELVVPLELSKRSLAMMDAAMVNLKAGKVSAPVDLSAFSATE